VLSRNELEQKSIYDSKFFLWNSSTWKNE